MTCKRNAFERRKVKGFRAAFSRPLNTLGTEMNLQELSGVHESCIATWREESPIKVETQWDAYPYSFVPRIIKITAAVRPIIEGLP